MYGRAKCVFISMHGSVCSCVTVYLCTCVFIGVCVKYFGGKRSFLDVRDEPLDP